MICYLACFLLRIAFGTSCPLHIFEQEFQLSNSTKPVDNAKLYWAQLVRGQPEIAKNSKTHNKDITQSLCSWIEMYMTLFSSSKLKGRMSYIGSVVIFHGSFDKMLKITKINTDVPLTLFVCIVWVVPDYLLRPIFGIREIAFSPQSLLQGQSGLEDIPKLMLVPFKLSYKQDVHQTYWEKISIIW